MLTRGVDADKTLWDWFKMAAIDGKIKEACVDGTIELIASDGKVVSTWSFKKGYASSYDFGAVDAGSEEVGVESITIKHHGLERA